MHLKRSCCSHHYPGYHLRNSYHPNPNLCEVSAQWVLIAHSVEANELGRQLRMEVNASWAESILQVPHSLPNVSLLWYSVKGMKSQRISSFASYIAPVVELVKTATSELA